MRSLWPYLTSFAVAAGLLTLLSCQPIPTPTNSVDPKWALVRYLGSIHQLPTDGYMRQPTNQTNGRPTLSVAK